ncbi:MAG: hypothetical protein JF587_18715 [Catenulisporales bacterium]|jgi:hypothetical protein|nr:hypothetical protein [Catenulisporales bacterium]
MRFPKFGSKRAAYRRLLAEVADNEVVREAEEVVGAAWMTGLLEAAGQTVGLVPPSSGGVTEFVCREREAWASAAKIRALGAIADRERLAEAARAAGIRGASMSGFAETEPD